MDCGLLEKMDPIMKDALYLFDAATRITYQQGHTYVPWDELKHSRYYCHSYCPRGHVVTHWEEALEYLCNEDVLGKEDLQGIGRIVFFPLLRNYEEHIAESLSEIMSLDPWIVTGNLNVEVGLVGVFSGTFLRRLYLIQKFNCFVFRGRERYYTM